MNIEETKKAIEVMQAFVDGKEIQANYEGVAWYPAAPPSWAWDNYDYRIKPQPKEIWGNEYKDGDCRVHNSIESAEAGCRDCSGQVAGMCVRKAVHYREVIEE